MTNSKNSELLELLELTEELDRRVKANPLKFKNYYKPKRHEKQIEAHEVMKSLRVLFWGNRVGKSEWGGMEAVHYVLGTHEFRNVVAPVEIWVGCPSFEMQKDTTQKKIQTYLPSDSIAHIENIRSDVWKEIKLKNGSVISFKSYEQGREKWQGAGKRLIWFDEEPPQDIFDEATVRVEAGQQLDIIMTMTPVKGMTWVYDRLFMATNNKDLFISTAGWDDNPYLTQEQKDQMERGLTDEALEVRKYGKFVKRVGLVCAWWDRQKNLSLYSDLPNDWTYFEVLDGGFSDPAAWLLIGVDKDNNVHVVDGFREKQLSDREIVSRRNTKSSGLLITRGWIDYSDTRLQENLQKLGVRLQRVEKQPGESQRWDEVLAEKLAEYGKMERGTGKPRLFINQKLDWLVQEVENLTWLEIRSQGSGGETQIVPKWDDHRRFGHHFDGIRALAYFLVMYNKPVKQEEAPEQLYKPSDDVIGI